MKTKDWLLFWLTGLIWGTSFLWIKIAVSDVTPVMLVAFRTFFGSLGLGIILFFTKSVRVEWAVLKKHIFNFIFLGTFNIAFPWMMFSWAGQFIDSGTSAILNGTMPLFTIMLSPLFVKDDRWSWPKVAGLLIGFLGIVVLMSPSVQSKWTNGLIGQAGILLAALSYAVSTIFARRRVRGLPALMQAFLQLTVGMIIIWTIAAFTERPMTFPRLPITWLALSWLGVLGSSVAFYIYFTILHKIGPTRTSLITYIPPLVGVVLGIVFLGEQFYWQALFGAVLILSGISIVNIRLKKPPHP